MKKPKNNQQLAIPFPAEVLGAGHANNPEIVGPETHELRTSPIPDPAKEFLQRHGFTEGTIENLATAVYRSRLQKGKYSYTKGANRKDRYIESPDHLLRKLQKWMLRGPLAPYTELVSDIACGIDSRQLPEMVEPHCGNRYFFKLDIEDAYTSVDLARLAVILASQLDTTVEQWLSILERFASGEKDGLAVGSKLSPLLFNLYMAPLDDEFTRIAENGEMTVTRYMDDIVFSSPSPIGKRRAKTIKDLLSSYNLKTNQHKVRYHDLEKDGPFMIVGAQINPSGSWHIANKGLKNILAEINGIRNSQQRDGNIDPSDIGVARGLHGYVVSSQQGSHRAQSHGLESSIVRCFWQIENAYQARHKGLL